MPEATDTMNSAQTQEGAQEIALFDRLRLPVGTRVEKIGGYPFPGTVVAAFLTLDGKERFVVQATGLDYAGMLHIFNGGQLRAIG